MTLPERTLRPPADVVINESLVRDLLRAQFPHLAGLTLEFADNGWDNVTYRLGSDLAVRLPRREAAHVLLLNEVRWLPFLAPRLPLPIPAARHRGNRGGLSVPLGGGALAAGEQRCHGVGGSPGRLLRITCRILRGTACSSPGGCTTEPGARGAAEKPGRCSSRPDSGGPRTRTQQVAEHLGSRTVRGGTHRAAVVAPWGSAPAQRLGQRRSAERGD